MKIQLFISSLIFLLVGFGTATKAQPLEFGLSFGVNLSNHTDEFRAPSGFELSPSTTGGYQAGLLFRSNISERIQIQAQPSLIKLGARYKSNVNPDGIKYRLESWTRLLYMQLPVLTQFHLLSNDKYQQSKSIDYFATGGIFGGYLLDARYSGIHHPINFTEAGTSQTFSEDVILNYSRYDAGAIIGLGMEYKSTIGVESRLQYTLLQTYRNPNQTLRRQNIAVTLSLFYLL